MAGRRSGRATALWNNVAAGANTFSNPVEVMRGAENLTIFVSASAATTVSVQVAHSSELSSEGVSPDSSNVDWMDAYYLNTPVQLVLAGAAKAALLVPDFGPGWIRLKTSAAVTLTAGYEASPG
jgi:hypothetical protein